MRQPKKLNHPPYLIVNYHFRCFSHWEVSLHVFSKRGKCSLFSNGKVQEQKKWFSYFIIKARCPSVEVFAPTAAPAQKNMLGYQNAVYQIYLTSVCSQKH